MAKAKRKLPKTIGECIDELYLLEKEVKAETKKMEDTLARKIGPQLDHIKVLREYMLDTFGSQKLEGARGKIAVANASNAQVPNIVSFDVFLKYVWKEKAFDLLYQRVGVEAWRERLKKKFIVPGTKVFNVPKLSVKKR